MMEVEIVSKTQEMHSSQSSQKASFNSVAMKSSNCFAYGKNYAGKGGR
jgi:hypothetical protein